MLVSYQPNKSGFWSLSPLILRELRAQAYSSVPWRLKLMGAFAPLAVGFYVAVSTYRPMLDNGAILYLILGATTTALLFFISPILTADCIGNERREGTLGLLFLTPITSRDIVWGKWLSHTISLLIVWLAAVPVIIVPVITGGVTGAMLIALPLVQLGSVKQLTGQM